MANSYKTGDVDKPGTMRGIFLQIIGSLKTVPALKKIIIRTMRFQLGELLQFFSGE